MYFGNLAPGTHLNTLEFSELKSKIRVFAHFARKSSIFAIIIANLFENGVFMRFLLTKTSFKKFKINRKLAFLAFYEHPIQKSKGWAALKSS